MISQELIERGGSKLEIARALLEAGSDIPIPNSTWKYYGQDLDSIKADFDAMRKPVIVRGSHRNDYHGFIDVIPTHRDIYCFEGLEDAVRDIENATDSEDVRIHCEDWNQSYIPDVHILIQEQSPSPIVGSMIRHPNNGNLMIQYLDITDTGGDREAISCAETTEFGLKNFSRLEITDEQIAELIRMYERLENSGIIDAEWSQQMEFGLRPLLFYQARPFKKFQPAQEFEIPGQFDEYPHIFTDMSFGVTPEEGIELPFAISDWNLLRDDFHERVQRVKNKEPYGWLSLHKGRASAPTGMPFGKITAFCPAHYAFNQYLFHGNYRLMKKADFSFIANHIMEVEKKMTPYFELRYNKNDLADFRESRIFSNGNWGAIVPIKYL